MKSIQTKIILLIFMGIVASVTIIGYTGIRSFEQAIDDDSVELMNSICGEKAQEINGVLGRIEQSVKILSVYARDNLESVDRITEDPEYLEAYTKVLDELGLTVANETDGAVAVYIRFNPKITNSKAGFFRVKNLETEQFEHTRITDFDDYSPDDIEHVGWYYIPVQAGEPVWLLPYYNENIDIYMISYVIPIYKDDELIGIVGMDIDFNFITDKADSIQVYETGEAFLTDENLEIVHSKSHIQGNLEEEVALTSEEKKTMADKEVLYEYVMGGVKRKVTFRTLVNGMCLAVTAPVAEIDSTKNELTLRIAVWAAFIVVVFAGIAFRIAKTIVKPLKELDAAAKEIAGGNLEVSLACNSRDEVGTLSESLGEMAKQLKRRIAYINNLAYMDKLTEIRNNTAYLHDVSVLKGEIEKGRAEFSVFVVDVNGLKVVNDTWGHHYGNQLIVAVSKVISEVFGEENVYRIGGDEFAVIRKDTDSETCSRLKQEFEKILKSCDGEIKPSAAIGSAVYDKAIDSSYASVFRRADGEMYKHKQQMKARGETSRVET